MRGTVVLPVLEWVATKDSADFVTDYYCVPVREAE